MAQYIFVKTRKAENKSVILTQLKKVCDLLTPDEIKNISQNFIGAWKEEGNTYYAIQNSKGIELDNNGALILGWVDEVENIYDDTLDIQVNGSYGIIKNKENKVSFFCDQFGSRTLWYYIDNEKLIVSTSQRAIVALKGSFNLNEQCIAWYLSSGCQGPFISWDNDIVQVSPNFKYVLEPDSWTIKIVKKNGMDLPRPGSVRKTEFINAYENQISKTLSNLISKYDSGEILLPVSGGLDSRLLLGLCIKQKNDNKVTLANWGVPYNKLFDDKQAAKSISKIYKKELLDIFLPEKINDFDRVLDKFISLNEGRIDHFNAFTDCFEMWRGFFNRGIKVVVRGDIPYTEGIDINEIQARSHIGLNIFNDYSNVHDFNLNEYINIQRNYNLNRSKNESLINWRDNSYIHWRVPMVISAFSQQISSYTENRAPMFNWELFKMYSGLPDNAKGNKKHINFLCKKNDKSGIPFSAIGSLYSMEYYFENLEGKNYLIKKLNKIREDGNLSSSLILSLLDKLEYIDFNSKSNLNLKNQIKNWLSENMPMFLKAYLKSLKNKNLSPITLSYRLIMIDKIIKIYQKDVKVLGDSKL